jgi:type II secretory pathway component GspD/PulD (secretin)
MKRQLILTMLGSLTLSASLALAQDAATPAAEPTETNAIVAVDASTNVVATTDVVGTDTATNVVAAIDAAAAEGVDASATNATPMEAAIEAPAADEPILIVIDDTPLLDAIRNLARQANINLIIDPKVGYGQIDSTGKAVPQPNVSIRWEDITAEQAFEELLNNYGLQSEKNPKVNITRIKVKDPAAPDPLVSKTLQLQYASPSNVIAAVNASFSDKRSKVVADVRTSKLVIVSTEKEMVDVEKLIAELDTPTKQVLIETRLVETAMNPTTVKGFNWQQTLGGGQGEGLQMRFGNTLDNNFAINDAGNDDPIVPPDLAAGGNFTFNPATAFLDSTGLRATLSFLNTSDDAKILASPRTVTLDNETAHIEAGQLYPIINVTAGTANTTGGSQVNYSNLTVRLDVTPRISANNLINLKVQPHVMRLESVQTFTAGAAADGTPSTFDVPIFATSTLDTRVMIPSGNTLVMGGLISDSVSEGNIKVPILGDIPFMGRLFRQDRKTREKGNLVVFITPTIVQDEDFQPTTTEYLKTPVPTTDEVDKDWTWWDSGKPASDWSKSSKEKSE